MISRTYLLKNCRRKDWSTSEDCFFQVTFWCQKRPWFLYNCYCVPRRNFESGLSDRIFFTKSNIISKNIGPNFCSIKTHSVRVFKISWAIENQPISECDFRLNAQLAELSILAKYKGATLLPPHLKSIPPVHSPREKVNSPLLSNSPSVAK